MKQSTPQIARAIAFLTAASGAAVVQAQLTGGPADPTRQFVSEGSNLQQETGYYIANQCERLGGLQDATEEQQLIGATCSEINRQASILNEDGDPELIAAGLSAIELISPEEVAAIASGFTDTSFNQLDNIASRLDFLRTGVATSVADVQWSSGMNGGAAGSDFSKFSLYVNGNFGTGDKDKTAQENGFDYDSYGLTVGGDYRFSDQLVGGIALSVLESEVEFDNDEGDTDSDGYTLTFYGSYYMDNFYVDGVLGFGQHDYDGTRVLDVPGLTISGVPLKQTIDSSTEADSLHMSIGGGYNINAQDWNYNLYSRLDYVDVEIDGYTETGSYLAMTVEDQDVESLQVIFGGQASWTNSVSWGVIVPYAGLEWRFETEDDTRVVTASYALDGFNNTFSFFSDDADSNYGVMSLGSNFVLAGGMQLFVNYDYVVGLEDVTGNTLSAGIRWEL